MRWIETAVVAVVGAALGWITGLPLGLTWIGASIGGLNGLIAGRQQIYNWKGVAGWAGFILDSTWGLVGTAGSLFFHGLQRLLPTGVYRPELSRRQGRHVYAGGYRLKAGFATAIGNVITNADGLSDLDGAGGPRRRLLIDRHEMLHVWQHRWFGPLFPALYTAWFVMGTLFGVVLATVTSRPIAKSVLTVAYYDNPFEYFAYRRDHYWPPAGADVDLAWKSKRSDVL